MDNKPEFRDEFPDKVVVALLILSALVLLAFWKLLELMSGKA